MTTRRYQRVQKKAVPAKRPAPPADLTEDEAAIWRATVKSEPADFFATAALCALLKDYCRHRAAGDKLSEVIGLFEGDWLKNAAGAKRYHDLLKARSLETKSAAGAATKLRLTNQSRYTPERAARAAKRVQKKLPPIGKKEQAQIDAEGARTGGIWGSLLRPN